MYPTLRESLSEGAKYGHVGDPAASTFDAFVRMRHIWPVCGDGRVSNLKVSAWLVARGPIPTEGLKVALPDSQRELKQLRTSYCLSQFRGRPPPVMCNVKPPEQDSRVRVGKESSAYLPAALVTFRLGARGCVLALCQLFRKVDYTNPGFPSPCRVGQGLRLLEVVRFFLSFADSPTTGVGN